MKSVLQYSIGLFMFGLLTTQLASCKKETSNADVQLSYQLLADKTWYLDFSITGTTKRTYVGQSTYFIDFLKNKTTVDSDGLTGFYTVEKMGSQLQIHVQAKTTSTNNVEYVYNIESIGSGNMILNYTATGATEPTKLYFSTNK
ncbi:MAG: hypothetical protein KA534_07725 [Sediminibacterium sp.]|nr:hypothetical protein [Sediminibacterium sp.]MBP6144474.1 hypothetical protein [Sediminibacterium sp.]